MHLFALIPFVAVLLAAAFGAISIAWNSDRRDTGAMSAIFGCAGVWALFDLIVQFQTDPAAAIFWLRLAHVPALFLGPLTLLLLAQLLPQCDRDLRPWASWGLGWAMVLGIGCALMPGVVTDATSTPWGDWIPDYGVFGVLLYPLGAILPVVAAHRAAHARPRASHQGDVARSRAIVVVVGLSLGVAFATEFALPMLAVPAPRLGALAVVLATGSMWLRVLHETDVLALSPHGMARSVLAKLHDGVALVRLDGTILSANARLAELTRRTGVELVGTRLDAIVNVSTEALYEGIADRESVLSRAGAEALPVALSSSLARDLRGDAIGLVVVFRDLRDVDILRRQLLTSGRLAAIGELAAGIAHEVNNPVAFIRADLNFLSCRLEELRETLGKDAGFGDDLPIFATGPARVTRAIEAIERIAQVVGDVRSFAHMGGTRQEGSDPVALVEGALRLARLERGGEVEVAVRAGGVTERVSAGQELKQVLLTLLRLLITSSACGGRIEVELESRRGELWIGLCADRLLGTNADLIARFEGAHAAGGRSRRDDLGLGIAAELVAQMGGALRAVETDDRTLRVELRLPFEEEGVS